MTRAIPHPMQADLKAAIDRDPPVVDANTTVKAMLAQLTCEEGLPGAPQAKGIAGFSRYGLVVEAGQVVGLLTDATWLRLAADPIPLEPLRVAQVMTPVSLILPEAALTDGATTLALLRRHRLRYLPVTDDRGQWTGVIAYERLLEVLVAGPYPLETGPLDTQAMGHQTCLAASIMAVISRFVAVDADHFDGEIGQALGQLGACLGVEMSYVAECQAVRWADHNPPIKAMTVTHRWSRLREDRHLNYPDSITQADFPWALATLLEQRVVRVPQVSALSPALGLDRDQWQQAQIEAILVLPLVYSRQLVGCIGFAGCAPTPWDNATVNLLTIVAQTIANAQGRLRAEQALVKSEAQSQAILATIPDLMFRVAADGVYRGFVTAHRHMDLIPDGTDPVGRSMFDLLPPAVAERQMVYLQRALQTGQLQIYEQQVDYRDQCRDEEVRVIQSGADEGLFMVRDISERQRTERQLQELNQSLERKVAERTVALQSSEAKLQAILNGSPAVIYVKDLAGRHSLVNRAFLEFFDCTLADVIGKTNREFFPAAVAERLDHSDHGLLRQGILPPCEESLTRQGTDYVFLSHKFLLCDRAGRPYALCGMATDITARKQAENTLQTLSQRLSLALKSGAIGCWDWDLTQNRVIWDEQMFRLYGVSPNPDGSVAYETWSNLLHPEDLAQTEALHQQALTSHTELDTEFRIIHPEGSIRHIKAYGMVARTLQGQAQSMIGINFDITARKQVEAALQDSEAKFRRLAENIPAVIYRYLLHPNGEDRFTYLSPHLDSIYGVQPEAALANPLALFSRVHPDDVAQLQRDIVVSAQNLSAFYSEHRITHAKGEQRWVQVISTPEPQINGDILWQGVILDISERKQAELDRQALFQELAAFKLALDESAIVSITDIHGVITYVNDRFGEISGYPINDILGRNHHLVNSGYHSRDFFQSLWGTILRGQVWRGEVCNRAKQGQLYWLDSTLVPFVADQGQPVHFLAVSFDITARKQAELALRDSNALLSTISQAQAQFITAANRLDIFESLLKRLLEVTNSEYAWIGMVRHQADGTAVIEECFFKVKGGADLYPESLATPRAAGQMALGLDGRLAPPLEMDEVNHWFAQAVATQQPVVVRQATPPPGPLPVKTFLGLPFCQGSLPVGVVGMANRPGGYDEEMIDYLEPFLVTCSNLVEGYRLDRERRQTEERLNQTNVQLAQATRLKDEFLANMSHELRTPLNAILGMAEGLQEEIFGPLNARQHKAVHTIEHSGAHLLELINDILDVAKIESGQVALDFVAIAIEPLCQASLAFIRQQAHKKSIQVQTQIPAHLPLLWGDERRLRQILINLLTNAVKFTPEGGRISLTVTVLPPQPLALGAAAGATAVNPPPPAQPSGWLRMAIADTGIGIAPDHQDKLFQPFIQIDSTLNRQYPGTGLGLALVKRLVGLHGGHIHLSSAVGLGSCFTVELPWTAPPRPRSHSLELTDMTTLPGGMPPANPLPLILLAEDNEANISTLSSYLGAKGFRITVAKHGEEAIAQAQAQPPDLILMDIQMPGMNGLEAIRHLRQLPMLGETPIIALTALTMAGDRDRCLAAGATDYLPKPVRLNELVQTMQALLGAERRSGR